MWLVIKSGSEGPVSWLNKQKSWASLLQEWKAGFKIFSLFLKQHRLSVLLTVLGKHSYLIDILRRLNRLKWNHD